MTDQDLIDRFERQALTGAQFHHRDHVRLAWLYLRRYSVLDALERFAGGLRELARRHNVANRYHATITWALFLLIHERMERGGPDTTWDAFAASNPDLLEWGGGANILNVYYRPETIESDLARRIFLLPDKSAGTS